MYLYDVETFMCACERKGLAAKTMGSYEQTLRLFGQFLSVCEIERTANITVSNTFVSEMAESKPWQTITNYQGNLLIAFTAEDEEILSQDTIDGTLEAAHARKINFVNLYGQFYDATHNYTRVEGADDEAVRNRIEAQTAQFFRQMLLWGTL